MMFICAPMGVHVCIYMLAYAYMYASFHSSINLNLAMISCTYSSSWLIITSLSYRPLHVYVVAYYMHVYVFVHVGINISFILHVCPWISFK